MASHDSDSVSVNTTDASESFSWSCSPSSEAESTSSQLRLFIALVALNVMKKCKAIQSQPQDVLVAHAKRLVDQTMEGLLVPEGYSPEHKSIKNVCKAVMKDLQKNVCSKGMLVSMILLQDPAVDAAIIKSVQAHITNRDVQIAKKTKLSLNSARRVFDSVVESLSFRVSSLFL